ncbi:hypothetical protein [Kitasatospora sp. NPDC059327]|uniref:hypothetical protein n=1 Tax=Kitasatospora sp. NPDC059327 TaxID=3346803 RepID=UPI0036873EC6
MTTTPSPAPTPPPGRVVTFLGIDGSGKDTLAAHLATRLNQAGTPTDTLSRRDYLLTNPTGPDATLNRTLYDAALRTFYINARTCEGDRIADDMPDTADLRDPTLERHLAGAEIGSNNPRTILAAALTETAGAMTYWNTVLLPRAATTGHTLIDPCHLLRSVIKNCVLVQQAAGDGTLQHRQAEQALTAAITLLRPNTSTVVPVLLKVHPATAYERRIKQHGRLGPFEHYGTLGGHTTRAAFLDLQRRVQQVLERAAADWRAVVVDMNPDGDVAWPAAIETITADDRMLR